MTTALKNSPELSITRVFDVPRENVWKAWNDPEEVKKWWGPKNFTAPHISIDFRVGGKYVYCMRGAGSDGAVKDFWNAGQYLEIVPMERIVATMSFADEQGNPVPASHYGMPGEWPEKIMVTVILEDIEDDRTRITVRETGIPGVMTELAGLGWHQQFDKLAEILASGAAVPTSFTAEPGKQEIVISRTYDAPRERVFRAYTDPERIKQWWGPKRFTTIIDRMDVRPGGIWRFVQRDAEGNEYAFHGVYHDIASPERIVSTFEFEGAPGHVSLDTMTFEEHNGRTRLTSRSVFQSVEDRDEMLKEGMEEGAVETMDRLAELLAKPDIGRKAA